MSELRMRRVKLESKEADFLLKSSLIPNEPWKPAVHNIQKRRLSALDISDFWNSILRTRRIQGVTGRRLGLYVEEMASRLILPRKVLHHNGKNRTVGQINNGTTLWDKSTMGQNPQWDRIPYETESTMRQMHYGII